MVSLLLGGCKAPPELRPDQELKDALGLTDRDRVHLVTVRQQSGQERPDPAETVIRPGDHLLFQNGDRRARSVRFLVDELSAEAQRWMSESVGARGPLLGDLDARWIVHFSDAPPGRYPFEITGGGESGRGIAVVEGG